jgi:hypothetical protein
MRLKAGLVDLDARDTAFTVRPRWNLEEAGIRPATAQTSSAA